ncbi:MAG: glycosyltransferase family 4 protein [Clostridia bacterium]|nr:glycosyltransferase family 4 protein [Clostridia bacterium]
MQDNQGQIKKKVLFITNVPSPYRVNFFNKFGKLVNLTVCFERRSASGRDKSWTLGDTVSFNPIFMKGINTGSDKAFCPEIRKIIKSGGFDHIIVSGYSSPTAMSAIKYMRKRKIPYILSSDGGLIKDSGSGFLFKFKKHFISGADAYLSTSGETDKYLIHYGALSDRIYRYPFTSLSEDDIFEAPSLAEEKTALRAELGLPQNSKIIVSVGRFIQSKGFDVLIESAKSLPHSAYVCIIGGTPTEEYIELMQFHNVSCIHFEDFKPFSDLVKFYRASDVFVLPTRTDVWGLVINEAMACGLPVITTEKCIAGVSLVKNGVNGHIVPIDNAEILAEKINNLLQKSSEEIFEAGKESIAIIKNYTVEKMAERHFEILSSFTH